MSEMDADGYGGVDFEEFSQWWRNFASKRGALLHGCVRI